jgi:ABC-type amino acid transport system permease subunit
VFGGYELFPVGDWLNTPGRVVVKFLPSVKASEAGTRDEMMRVLRRRILNGLMDPAVKAATALSLFEYLLTYAVGISILLINVSATRKLNGFVCHLFEVTIGTASLFIIFGSMLITVILYVYHLYILDWLHSGTEKRPK